MTDASFETYLKDCAEVGEKIKSIREDERKRFINKACEYLESALKHDLGYYSAIEFANTFKKAMEK